MTRSSYRSIAVILTVCVALSGAIRLGVAEWLDGRIEGARFALNKSAPTGSVLLVDIDAKSLAEIGVWPWPRRLHAELLDAANKAGAASVAFDVDFSARSVAADDDTFAQALSRSNSQTFIAAFAQRESAFSPVLQISLAIAPISNASWPALVNVTADPDNLVRQFPYGMQLASEPIASMPSLLAGIEGDSAGTFGIDYGIDASRLSRVSYVDVLKGRIPGDAIHGRKLIVGATAIELHDLFSVPVYGMVSGSTVIGLATETLLQNRPLTYQNIPTWPLIGALAIFLLLVPGRSFKTTLALLAAAAIWGEAICFWLQASKAFSIPTATFQLTLASAAIGLALQELGVRRLLLWVTKRELRTEQSILAKVMDDGFDGIIVIDDKGNILRANNHALKLLRREIRSVNDLPERLQHLVQQAQGGSVHDLDRIQDGDDEVILEYSVSTVQTADHAGPTASITSRVTCIAIRDVTSREVQAESMRFFALNDSLTGLPNRRSLEQHMEKLLQNPYDHDAQCLISFDLDRFKLVNDTLGHAVGDGVLVEVAERAKAALSASLVARLGGDEFFALVAASDCEGAVTRLRNAVGAPFFVMGHRVSVGISIGIANVSVNASPSDLLRHADVALYRAKTGSGVAIFDPSMEVDRLERLSLERDLQNALEDGQLHIAFQPQVRLLDGEVVGAEALVRWNHPKRGSVSPAVFIPVAEEMGLVNQLGDWVLVAACQQAAGWARSLKVAVNVSAIQFATGNLVESVRTALRISGLDPTRLELEITESVFVQDSIALQDTFDRLRSIGVSFALDDFGTGYSSLGYLHRFPISKVKIDQSFTRAIGQSTQALAVLRAVRVLAAGLDIRTIAEGVETPEQCETLKELGYEEVQGYLFGKPQLANEFAERWKSSAVAPAAAA